MYFKSTSGRCLIYLRAISFISGATFSRVVVVISTYYIRVCAGVLPAPNPTLSSFQTCPDFQCVFSFYCLSFAYKLNPYCACEADCANYANDPWIFFVLQIKKKKEPSASLNDKVGRRWGGGGGEKARRSFIIV